MTQRGEKLFGLKIEKWNDDFKMVQIKNLFFFEKYLLIVNHKLGDNSTELSMNGVS